MSWINQYNNNNQWHYLGCSNFDEEYVSTVQVKMYTQEENKLCNLQSF